MSSSPIRVRFAPSPTGYLHVGGARTALFNWLLARGKGGKLVLRIEDTDAARNTQEAMDAITEGLRWLGLDWDEGPEVGGDFGPYYQSERKAIYGRYLEQLEAAGRVYTEENGAVRFKFSRQPITIPDMVCGDIQFAATEEPDMTVRRPDGGYIFHFCNVVDDIEMGITHVIRGEDHISNTWKHIDLFHALGKTPPVYGHIPLLLNPNGSKMSKRDAGASVGSYREAGFLPQAVFNYLCLLGWTPKAEGEVFTAEEALKAFDIGAVHHSNAKFDLQKCVWLNQQHLRGLSDAELVAYVLPWLEKAGVKVGEESFVVKVLNCVKEKVSLASEFAEWVHFFFTEEFPIEDDVQQKLKGNVQAGGLLKALQAGLSEGMAEWTEEKIAERLTQIAGEQGVKAGALMPLLRFALSGQTRGPDVKVMMGLLGQERVVKRLVRLGEELQTWEAA